MGDSAAGDASAGSKIFVGGLDRTVDEGATRSRGTRARDDDGRDATRDRSRDRSIARDGTIRDARFDAVIERAGTDETTTRADAGVVRNFFSQFGPVMEVRDARGERGARSTTRWGGARVFAIACGRMRKQCGNSSRAGEDCAID